MIIDHKGWMKLKKFNFSMDDEFIEVKTRVAMGIIDVYLKNLLDVTPGNTLEYRIQV